MRKNILFVLFAVTMVFVSEAQIKKAAIISVFGSRNLSDNPLETQLYETIMKDSSFNLKPVMTKFEEAIQEAFIPQFPFPFLTKQEVTGHEGYAGLADLTKYGRDNWTTTSAEGYIPIAAYGIADDVDAIKAAFQFYDVDAVMIVFINFNIYDAGGYGQLAKKKIYANVNVKLFDKDGERIFKLKERATSNSGVLAVGGVITDVSKLMPMINESSDNLISDMNKVLPKKLAKMAEELAKK